MTAMDRPDRLPKFEEALRLALQEDAGTAQTDYLTDILIQTVASRQRPAWTYPSRWLPMSVITSRAAAVPRVPVRAHEVARCGLGRRFQGGQTLARMVGHVVRQEFVDPVSEELGALHAEKAAQCVVDAVDASGAIDDPDAIQR